MNIKSSKRVREYVFLLFHKGVNQPGCQHFRIIWRELLKRLLKRDEYNAWEPKGRFLHPGLLPPPLPVGWGNNPQGEKPTEMAWEELEKWMRWQSLPETTTQSNKSADSFSSQSSLSCQGLSLAESYQVTGGQEIHRCSSYISVSWCRDCDGEGKKMDVKSKQISRIHIWISFTAAFFVC